MVCKSCGKELNEDDKFCGFCGAPVKNKIKNFLNVGMKKDNRLAGITVNSDFIYWDILPGQIAVKLDDKMIDSFKKAKGFSVQDGIKAIIFVDGNQVNELSAGMYDFDMFVSATDVNKDVTVLLIRENGFPLVYTFENMPTAQIRSNVALQCILKITNIIDFYKNFLVDKKFLSLDTFAKTLENDIVVCIENAISEFTPEEVSSLDTVEKIFSELKSTISNIYNYITLERIVRLTADNAELEQIRQKKEALYIEEKELEELSKRNEFLNRLNEEKNAQLLSESQTQADFANAMNKIDEQNLLTEEEKNKFAQTLYVQRQIRNAKSDDEVESAIAEIRKAGILRNEEIDVLEAQVAHRAEMQALSDGQILALATFQNEKILEAEKLEWEFEVDDKRLEHELEQKKKQDAYADDRRKAEMKLDNEEMASQMELLRQAQELRQERTEAEHKLEMEKRQQEIEAQQNITKLYAGMTVEQIMVSNPNITPEAANAMAEKFKAESANDKVEMANQQKDEMRQFMEQQIQLMRDMVTGNRPNGQ